MSGKRIVAVVGLLALGLLSLPVVALFLDGEGTQNWIVPVQLLLMAAIGALVGRTVPALAGDGASRGRATLIGALVGVGAALLALAVFFVLLSGFGGA